jgi:hypothetical protein
MTYTYLFWNSLLRIWNCLSVAIIVSFDVGGEANWGVLLFIDRDRQ